MFGHRLIDWVADYLENSGAYNVLPSVQPDDIIKALPPRGPEQGEPIERIFADFERIILPTLEKIDYDPASKLATKRHLSPLVVLDPRICFGQPIVEPVAITTYVLAAFYLANGRNAKTVANWYEIEEEHVMAAVEFETLSDRDVRRLARA